MKWTTYFGLMWSSSYFIPKYNGSALHDWYGYVTMVRPQHLWRFLYAIFKGHRRGDLWYALSWGMQLKYVCSLLVGFSCIVMVHVLVYCSLFLYCDGSCSCILFIVLVLWWFMFLYGVSVLLRCLLLFLYCVCALSLFIVLVLCYPNWGFFRVFPSVVRQLAGYNSQRRGTARTSRIVLSMYCLHCLL